MSRYRASHALQERAKIVMPCLGAQTLSKGPDRNPANYPVYLVKGQGSHVWCADGHEYIDYVSALGPLILGHAHPAVTAAAIEQAQNGNLFSLEHPLTVEVAEMLTAMIPGAEAVRFVKTGSDAVSAAVRAARTYTRRDVVLVASNSYHGSHNWFQCTQKGRGEYGVPANELRNIGTFRYDNLLDLEDALKIVKLGAVGQIRQKAAAVIIEPARDFMATPEFLQGARKLCDEHGALLIFDEVVTFGRFGGLTASAHFGVTADLTCLGKAMANGYPLGACVGRRDVMNAFEKCFISGTYNGETTALAAAKACLTILRDEPVVDHIWRHGALLMQGFTAAMDRYDLPATADGIPPCWRQNFHGPRARELKMAFMSLAAERGILPGLICYAGYSHSDEDIRKTVSVYYEVAEVLGRVLETPMEVGI